MTPDIDFSDSNFVDDILKNCNILRTRAMKAEASLAEAEALIRKNAELMNGYLTRIADLEAQVAALQEIAIEQKAMRICTIPANWWNEGEQVKEYFRASARRQLAKEHPEAFR